MKKKRLRKKNIPSFYFTRVSKIGKIIDDLIEVPIVLELKDGKFFAGYIDDCENRVINVFSCKKLVNKKVREGYREKTWQPYDIMAWFPFKDIKNIYRAKDESLSLEQILELTINPYAKPAKGIQCTWIEDGKHSDNCDEDLHESLTKLYKEGDAHQDTKKKREEFKKAFYVVRRFIIENNGRIP